MDEVWRTAAIWMALAFAASLVSIRLGLSVAMAEILAGIIGGNFFGLHTNPWIDFLASFGAVLLTFLAGAEIDPASFRQHLRASLVIGAASFLAPFIAAWLFAYYVVGWGFKASEIAGISLSTTSVAVVYAVMLETGYSKTDLGKLILAACFVTDFGTVLALGLLFANFSIWMAIFVGAIIPTLWLLPKITPRLINWWGKRISEPELKLFFLVLFLLAWLASAAGGEAVLPAYMVGLGTAGVFVGQQETMHRIRAVAFALLTPFYFLKAGMFVALSAVVASFGLIAAYLGVKVAAKFIGVWPVTGLFKMRQRERSYTTLLMSTGLTFGTISALFGLTHGAIDQTQYTVLVTAVIGSAIVPTVIAQTWFRPREPAGDLDAAERPSGAAPRRRPAWLRRSRDPSPEGD